jgi:hypothetical protein
LQTQSTVEGKYSPEYDAFVPRDCNSDASTRDEENWEDAAAAEPTSDWEQDTLHYPTPADSEWEREDAQYPTTAYSTTPDRSETGTLETNPEMHDSISSLKETGFDKNALEYSVNTMPVEEYTPPPPLPSPPLPPLAIAQTDQDMEKVAFTIPLKIPSPFPLGYVKTTLCEMGCNRIDALETQELVEALEQPDFCKSHSPSQFGVSRETLQYSVELC